MDSFRFPRIAIAKNNKIQIKKRQNESESNWKYVSNDIYCFDVSYKLTQLEAWKTIRTLSSIPIELHKFGHFSSAHSISSKFQMQKSQQINDNNAKEVFSCVSSFFLLWKLVESKAHETFSIAVQCPKSDASIFFFPIISTRTFKSKFCQRQC